MFYISLSFGFPTRGTCALIRPCLSICKSRVLAFVLIKMLSKSSAGLVLSYLFYFSDRPNFSIIYWVIYDIYYFVQYLVNLKPQINDVYSFSEVFPALFLTREYHLNFTMHIYSVKII